MYMQNITPLANLSLSNYTLLAEHYTSSKPLFIHRMQNFKLNENGEAWFSELPKNIPQEPILKTTFKVS